MHPPRQHRDSGRRNGPRRDEGDLILSRAREFTPDIEPILDLEGASAEAIKTAVESIETLVKKNARVKTHQVRNIFNLVKGIEGLRELNMLRPKLAYIGARQTGMDGKIIVKVMDELIIKLMKEHDENLRLEKLKGLQYVMESIVAYHKFYSKDKD